jgi:competence protein ComEC
MGDELIYEAKPTALRDVWRVMLIGWIAGAAAQLQQSALWPLHALAISACACALANWALIRWPPALKGSVWISGISLTLLSASMAWSVVGLRAHVMLSAQMPPALEGRNLDVVGVVVAMPQRSESGLRFRFDIESALLEGQPVRVPQQVYLAWYGGAVSGMEGVYAERAVAGLQAGERWQWRIRLKAPHGHMNPGGFDYELWLWEQGLHATGYVRTGANDPAPVRLGQTYLNPMEWVRQSVRDAIVARFAMGQGGEAETKLAGVVAALVTGDQSAIDRSDWDVFRATGVAHLMSISGLHITLFAWLAAALVGALWRQSALWGWHWCLHWPAPHAALVGGVVLATAYALFSGWGVPAQRTVWMLAMVGVLRLSGRHWPWVWVWTLALGVVVLFDPWALYQAGFWLSFVAVGVLFATSSPPINRPEVVQEPAGYREWFQQYGWLEKFWRLLREQWVVTWALTPLSVLFFGQISVVGLLANLLAIPWVTLVVTPLAMGGVLWPGFWTWAVAALQPLQFVLAEMASWSWATAYVAVPPLGLAMIALMGGLLMAMPWPWKLRCLGIPLLVPALGWQVPRPLTGHFELLALDLGQGNAVLVRTAQHSLLYDTGPRYSVESDAGHRVVVPLMRRWNERLDTVMLSHRDSDHTGGAGAVMAMQPSAALISSLEWGHPLLDAPRPLRADHQGPTRCAAGQTWTWDGVRFEVLHPLAQNYVQGARSNSLSCVLRISNAHQTALLVGDIEAPQELALVNRATGADGLVLSLKADVLLVPHHGSKTSSTAGFIDAVSPRWAWVQAGYRNRFGHPASEVVARYRVRNIEVVDSAHCGAMQWRSEQAAVMQCERTKAQRYWHHKAP